MADMLFGDSLKGLQTLIDQHHLLYLELDENPKKIDQRDKLESYIKDYLCLAPHDLKFTFQQTADVLHQSACTKNNFSAYKAAVAWRAIGKYADNLISHPWRKEYRDVKLYCGFYKHEIEENLVGAEVMFEAMGYRHAGQSSMCLPGIIDPDRITSVSKDAIVAFVECQMMKVIWETLSSHFNITWLEILEFRENHTGTPDQVIRALTYKYRQRHYQEQIYHKSHYQTVDHFPSPECLYIHHSMGYYNHPAYQGQSYSYPVQSRYGPVINTQQMMPSSIYPSAMHSSYGSNHQTLKPQDMYLLNGYHMHPHYTPQIGMPHVPHNGYPMVPMMCPLPSVVPTGQLIELDSSPTHNGGEVYVSRSTNSSKYHSPQSDMTNSQDCLKNVGPTISNKAKDDGAGSWENWDYVYRNLESQRNKKEQHSLDDNIPYSSQNNSSEIDETDLSDKVKKLNLDASNHRFDSSSSRSRTDFDEQTKIRGSRDKSKIELEISKETKSKSESGSGKLSVKKDISRKNSELSSSSKGSGGRKENDYPSTSKEGNKPKREETKFLVVNLDDDEKEKWQCITCTFLNSVSNTVCEMCYKSRERGSEFNPQPSGGAECPKCTLVNEPGLVNCAACNSSLQDSPTYI